MSIREGSSAGLWHLICERSLWSTLWKWPCGEGNPPLGSFTTPTAGRSIRRCRSARGWRKPASFLRWEGQLGAGQSAVSESFVAAEGRARPCLPLPNPRSSEEHPLRVSRSVLQPQAATFLTRLRELGKLRGAWSEGGGGGVAKSVHQTVVITPFEPLGASGMRIARAS